MSAKRESILRERKAIPSFLSFIPLLKNTCPRGNLSVQIALFVSYAQPKTGRVSLRFIYVATSENRRRDLAQQRIT